MPGFPAEDLRPLRWEGGRFEEASRGVVGFPLDAIVELARYERLLIQVARGFWLRDHPTRERVPKRFEDTLHLRLTSVVEGSVAPVLERTTAGPSTRLFEPDDLIARSQEGIAEAIVAVVSEQPLSIDFPENAVPSLVQFGSSLRDDEVCVLARQSGPDVSYTQQARRHLVKVTSPEDIKIEGDLVGRISGLEAQRQTFWFSDRAGHRVEGKFAQLGMFADLKKVANPDPIAPYVKLSCRYATNVFGQLSAIDDIDDLETIVGVDDPLGRRLRELFEIKSGWLNGEGAEPNVAGIEWIRDLAAEVNGETGVDLRVFPTTEGGVLAEQQTADRRWSLEIDAEGDAFVAIVRTGSAQSEEPRDVVEAAESLRRFLSQ